MLSAMGWRAGAVLGVLLGLEGVAFGQTWVPPRERPSLNEIVAVDATGETVWAYGEEDVDPTIDIRTAYATTDPALFYVRMYFSDGSAPATGVVGYVFIDADSNDQTGGPADDATVDADLPADPTPGGYDYVIGIQGGGTLSGIWEWTMATSEFTAVNLGPLDTDAEAGQDFDPIGFVVTERGYLQAAVELGAVGLTEACSARLFFRSVALHMKANPDIERVRVEGHTDETGSRELNVRLSQQRAASVRQHLIAQGVAPNRLVAKGYGPDEPLASGTDPKAYAKNRRVEFILED